MMKDLKINNNYIKQGLVLALASIICRAIGLVYRIILTNIIGDVGNGLYGYAFEIYNIALLLSSFSMPLAISKLMSERMKKGEYINAKNVFKISLYFSIIISSILSLLIFFLSNIISTNLLSSPFSRYALIVLSPCVLIVAIMGVFRGFYQSFGTMTFTSISQIIEQIVNAIISILGAYFLYNLGQKISSGLNNDLYSSSYGAAGGTLGTVLGALAGLIYLIITYRLINKKEIFVFNPLENIESKSKILKSIVITIIPIILSAAMFNILNIVDPAIFNYYMKNDGVPELIYASEFGMYSGKFMQLANIPISISNALAVAAVPIINRLLVDGKKHEICNVIKKTVKYSMIITLPCIIGYIILGKDILMLLWNDSSQVMFKIILFGIIQILCYSISTISNVCLQALGLTLKPVKNAIISFVIHIIILLVLLNTFKLGIYSIPLSGGIFAFCMCVLNYIDIHKAIKYKASIKNNYIKPFAVCFILGALINLFKILISNILTDKLNTLICIILFMCTYLIIIVKIKILKESELKELPFGNIIYSFFKKTRII